MHPYDVLKRPILTEKSSYQADLYNRYTFAVDYYANKHEIKQAVEKAFDVRVRKVNVMIMPGKAHRFGRSYGYTSDWKKAIVTLEQGESISFFEGV